MKKQLLAFAFATLVASCQSGPEGETAQSEEKKEVAQSSGTAYNLDLTTSKVTFIGSKPVGTHTGEFALAAGNLNVDNGNITSGAFTIDINSMNITDQGMDEETKGKLKGHLLAADFFEAAKYGTAKFEITGCEALNNDSTATHRISGNLTLKDSTKNVTIPAKVSMNESGLTATADFNIDRTQWGLFYGNDKSLGDKFIYPEVKILLNIQAKK